MRLPWRLIEGCQALNEQTGRTAPLSMSIPMQPRRQLAVMISREPGRQVSCTIHSYWPGFANGLRSYTSRLPVLSRLITQMRRSCDPA